MHLLVGKKESFFKYAHDIIRLFSILSKKEKIAGGGGISTIISMIVPLVQS